MTGYCRPVKEKGKPRYRRFWAGSPAYWGFHDCIDVRAVGPHQNNTYVLEHFTSFARRRLENTKLLMSEAGVELNDDAGPTELMWPAEPSPGLLEEDFFLRRQAKAAYKFLELPEKALRLGKASHALDRMY